MSIQQNLEDWKHLDPKKKVFFGVSFVAIVLFTVIHYVMNEGKSGTSNDEMPTEAPVQSTGTSSPGSTIPQPNYHLNVLPTTNRNQGLEDLHTRLDHLESLLANLPQSAGKQTTDSTSTNAASLPSAAGKVDLNSGLDKPFDPNVDFMEPPTAPASTQLLKSDANQPSPSVPRSLKVQVLLSENKPPVKETSKEPTYVIPVNSGIEAVMLTGINARQPGTTSATASLGAASSAANSATNVGAPFVTKIKGDAILPNGWRLSDLGDCFLGGSGVAILSTSRANVIADTLSCVSEDGEVWEAPIKAYGVDVDGTLGLAGKVVNKQGAILLQSALTGAAAGLGAAFTPSPIAGYNSNAASGSSQGYQMPNPNLVFGTMVGQGLNNASSQLSKFYLEFAREVFPVVEVPAGNRVTWVLKETIELKKKTRGSNEQ